MPVSIPITSYSSNNVYNLTHLLYNYKIVYKFKCVVYYFNHAETEFQMHTSCLGLHKPAERIIKKTLMPNS